MFKFSDLALLGALVCAAAPLAARADGLARPNAPTDAQRAAAAKSTVKNNPLCSQTKLKSYYWELGNQTGVLVSGRVGGRIAANSVMNIGSSSKWVYAAYIAERFGSVPANVPYLNLSSGYSNFDSTKCPDNGSVADCNPGPMNAVEAAGGIFHYDGGHMQQHAILAGMGFLRNQTLADEIRATLGTDISLAYKKPQLAGGLRIDAVNFAVFLRKLLIDSPTPLVLGSLLGSQAECTLPSATCNAQGTVQVPEAWHYSLGHWVEDDAAASPRQGFAYSSPGLAGFYPWVDTDRRLYGIISRNGVDVTQNEPYASAQCGRVIRLAWKTGLPQ